MATKSLTFGLFNGYNTMKRLTIRFVSFVPSFDLSYINTCLSYFCKTVNTIKVD